MGLHHEWVNHIDNIPAMSLKKKLKATQWKTASCGDAFEGLDATVPNDVCRIWIDQEMKALADRFENLKAMDIFEVQLEKGKPDGIQIYTLLKYPWKP